MIEQQKRRKNIQRRRKRTQLYGCWAKEERRMKGGG
jgi:hypothetical protein